jgi:hypothetical protein
MGDRTLKPDHLRVSHRDFFQLYWWRKTPGAPPGIISGTSGHPGRTTDLP